MKKLLLSNNHSVLVDNDVYEWVVDYNWSAHTNAAGVIYAKRMVRGCRGKDHTSIALWLHRLIAGVPPIYKVAFIDRNPHNCTKANIEIRTPLGKQVHWTAGVGESIFLGVGWNNARGVWNAAIANMVFSTWDNEIDAARAYNVKAREVFGDKAAINEIPWMEESQYLRWPTSDDRAKKTSPYRGVQKRKGRYVARLHVSGKKVLDWSNRSERAAKDTYDAEAQKHGAVERINK
jgi:hypothetical protein